MNLVACLTIVADTVQSLYIIAHDVIGMKSPLNDDSFVEIHL